MYAIVEVGSKQYRVKKGDVLDVEKLSPKKDKEIVLDKVLLVCTDKDAEVGQPYLKKYAVKAEFIAQVKAKKAVSFKYRRRKSTHRKVGHRQQLTRIKIKDIEAG